MKLKERLLLLQNETKEKSGVGDAADSSEGAKQCDCGSRLAGECPDCDYANTSVEDRLDLIGGENAVNPPDEDSGEVKKPIDPNKVLGKCEKCGKNVKEGEARGYSQTATGYIHALCPEKDAPEACPHCSKEFKQLSRHKCKQKPKDAPDTTKPPADDGRVPAEPETPPEEPKKKPETWIFRKGDVIDYVHPIKILETWGTLKDRKYHVEFTPTVGTAKEIKPIRFDVDELEIIAGENRTREEALEELEEAQKADEKKPFDMANLLDQIEEETSKKVVSVVEFEDTTPKEWRKTPKAEQEDKIELGGPNVDALLDKVGEKIAKEHIRLLEFLDERFPQDVPADLDKEDGFVLFIDCICTKDLIEPVETFEYIIKPLGDAVAKENGVPHWSTIDFGKSPGLLSAKLERWLKEETPTGAIMVTDSNSAEARACLQILQLSARHVVRGIR